MFMNQLNFENLPDKLSCVKFAVKNNWPISNKCCDFCSDTDIIKYILDQKITLDYNMIYYNTYNRNYDFVDNLVHNKYKINSGLIKILIKQYKYHRIENNFIKTGINKNENNVFFNKVVHYIENSESLNPGLFMTCIYNSCYEIIPILLKFKCPIDIKILKKYIDVLNLTEEENKNNFLVNMVKTIVNEYDDFELQDEF